MSVAQAEPTFEPPPSGEFFGHPRALWNLFGAEFWERFCYYGMRAILGPYVALAFFSHLANAESEASLTYGGYTSMVYMTGILGGYVADRVLGYQRSIMLGGSLMVVGMAPGAWRYLTRKCSTRAGMSSRRSRSGGMSMWMTFSR